MLDVNPLCVPSYMEINHVISRDMIESLRAKELSKMKKPLNGYQQYVKKHFAKIRQSENVNTSKEAMSICAEQWKKIKNKK